MKKIILLALFLLAGIATAQVDNTLTAAQIAQNKQIVAAKTAMETKVNKQTTAIMRDNNIAATHKSTVDEIVMQKESGLARIDREKLDPETKKARVTEVKTYFDNQLQAFLNSIK